MRFKEAQEHLAQFIYAIGFYAHWNLTSIKNYKLTGGTKRERPYLPIGAKNRGTTLIPPQRGYLRRSVTGAPVPVIPGNAGNGLQVPFAEGFHRTPLASDASLAWFPHGLYISPSFY